MLDMSRQEEAETLYVLRHQRIPYKRRLTVDGRIRCRFHKRHLEAVLSTFPFAELSAALELRMRRATPVALDEEIPDIRLPDLRLELYDFQKLAVQAIVDNPLFMLNDEMGLGKTIMALAAMLVMMSVPALVVCPSSAKWVWERMVQRFTDLTCSVADGVPADRLAAIEADADITVVNVEMLQKAEFVAALLEVPYELAVVDEFHRFKSPTAQQTKGFHELEAGRWLLMSGTPILGRVEDSWSALHRLFPARFPSFYSFERWLCIKKQIERHKVEFDKRGKRQVKTTKVYKVVGYEPHAWKQCRSFVHKHSMRRRKDQVLQDLPEVVHSILYVDLTAEQRRIYNRIVQDMEMELADGRIRTVRDMRAVIMRAKQACFSPELFGGSPASRKIDELKLLMEQLVDNGQKAIVFNPWKKGCAIIQRELADYNPAVVTGSVIGNKRMAQVDRFNEDPDCHVYVGTIMANRESITLDAASYVVMTGKEWVPAYNDQAIARSPSGGLRGVGKVSVNVVDFFARDTVEERVEAVLEEKRGNFNAFVEKDGGVPQNRITVKELRALF